ncbi:MAG: transcriptional repressor LexA [Planctomycetaceae bacterium]|nr:transcriptional repressor LexA [Planctomycetaceae bacterium]
MRTSPETLTDRQKEVLTFIIDHIGERSFPPTVAEIATKFGFNSPNASASHLNALRKKGYIRIEPRASRGIEVLKTTGGAVQHSTLTPSIPIVGRVSAGSPILAEQHIEGELALDSDAFKKRADYLLRVHGDSMIDAGIYEGDLIAVHRTQEVRSGDVIVANVNGDVTVKTLRRKGKQVELEAANKRYKPISVDNDKDEFAIEGLCVGVIRAM